MDTDTVHASFTICPLASQSLSCPLNLFICSLTLKRNYTFSFHLSCYSSPTCQSDVHADTQKELVFTRSCIQLPATRRYLNHETHWPMLFIRSIKIAPPWMSMNLPSVCLWVCVHTHSEWHPASMHQRLESSLSTAKKTACFLSRLHQSHPISPPPSVLDCLTFWHPCHTYSCKCVGCTLFDNIQGR